MTLSLLRKALLIYSIFSIIVRPFSSFISYLYFAGITVDDLWWHQLTVNVYIYIYIYSFVDMSHGRIKQTQLIDSGSFLRVILRNGKTGIIPWWHCQMEIFSALLDLYALNSPVTGEFPPQRPVTWNFDLFFDLCLNEQLSKQWWGCWFEAPSCLLWRHCNVINILQQ